MDLGSILLILAATLLTGLVITRPFANRRTQQAPLVAHKDLAGTERERSQLLAERDRALTALQELEFDARLGKIPAEDYPQQRAVLVQAGAEALRKLDELAKLDSEKSTESQMQPRRLPSHGEDEIEQLLALRRRTREEKSAGFCCKCGYSLQKSDRFCPKCGSPVD